MNKSQRAPVMVCSTFTDCKQDVTVATTPQTSPLATCDLCHIRADRAPQLLVEEFPPYGTVRVTLPGRLSCGVNHRPSLIGPLEDGALQVVHFYLWSGFCMTCKEHMWLGILRLLSAYNSTSTWVTKLGNMLWLSLTCYVINKGCDQVSFTST